MSYLCIPLTGTTCDEMLAQAGAARAAGAEMIELRLDYLQQVDAEAVAGLVAGARRLGLRVLATCRIATEGGKWHGSEAQRARLLTAAADAGADAIDVEYAAWSRSSELRDALQKACEPRVEDKARTLLILSRHDFEQTPRDLDAAYRSIGSSRADVPKIACKANTVVDAFRVLDLLHAGLTQTECGSGSSPVCYARDERRGIALAMGEAGLATRVLARKLGAFLTFASLEAGKESAPGQVLIADMRGLYRWDAMGRRTKVYGVIGCPVAHSMSPAMHNAAFDTTGHDGVYLPFRVEPDYDAFAAFLDACLARPWLDVSGFSVTIPHKENLLRYVREHGGEIEPLAARIGVANTLVIERAAGFSPRGLPEEQKLSPHDLPASHNAATASEWVLSACNTDYVGALDALCAGMGTERAELVGMRVAVLGAGGASRAIVAGLCDCGAQVIICNRTFEKAEALAAEFGATALPWDQRGSIGKTSAGAEPGRYADVIINCTSIGMWPHADDTPLPSSALVNRPAVFDTVYNPIETRLLREAREHGCRTIDGLGMLVRQAARQFTLWTGEPAPLALMDRIARERLSR